MDTHSSEIQARHLFPRQFFTGTDLTTFWRIDSGAVRIDCVDQHNVKQFVRLALPSDIIGLENAVGVTDQIIVRAIIPTKLTPVSFDKPQEWNEALMTAVQTSHRRCREVVSLRTGSVDERVNCLLELLFGSNVAVGDKPSANLPSLINIAEIVHSTPETVCRILSNLREAQILPDSCFRNKRRTPLQRPARALQMAS